MAQLLDRTGEFEKRGQKRYDDTRILITLFNEGGGIAMQVRARSRR